MRLQLDQARKGPLHWNADIRLTEAETGRGEALVVGSVGCEGRLAYVGPDFLLQARLRYRQLLHCNRCLTGYEQEVELPLSFAVTSRSEDVSLAEEGAGARELALEDVRTLTAVEGAVDLALLVREQVELNVPMKPICDPECPGLCPHCGADRKLEACSCGSRQVDPRWSGLEAIRERLGENLD